MTNYKYMDSRVLMWMNNTRFSVSNTCRMCNSKLTEKEVQAIGLRFHRHMKITRSPNETKTTHCPLFTVDGTCVNCTININHDVRTAICQ